MQHFKVSRHLIMQSIQKQLPVVFVLLYVLVQGGLAVSVPGQVTTCEANGSTYYVGDWYFLDSDHCMQCECTEEGAACARTECTALPPACIYVSHYPTDCCPRCEKIGCEYRGEVYELGEPFQPSECEQCICEMDGVARCLVADCAPPPCVNPLYEKGKCCPECKDGPNCYTNASHTRIMPGGKYVWIDSCTKCRCHDGHDVGYWEGSRVAKCTTTPNCKPDSAENQ
ncbi:von Willebrand factor C domain-containing protein 2-like [Protopterus annectens]|uniref:von Willebrand factor C domain-containing protein 2-like n=1 Tax=Protopterus annectens TaxID=7888 RepID=UPI001CFBF9C5|nr:von Willebrand factor C domain-containing protein 2-like [Protopterus annectens]